MRMSRRIATAARATLSRIRISNRSLSHSTSTNTVAVDSIKFNNLNPNIQSISLFSTCSTRHSSNQYSSSSHLDQSKVVALPFRLSSEQLNQTTSELAIVSANLVENSFFKAGLYLLARKLTKSLGIDAFFGLRHGAIGGKGVRKLRERRIYLPTWVSEKRERERGGVELLGLDGEVIDIESDKLRDSRCSVTHLWEVPESSVDFEFLSSSSLNT